MTEQRVIEIHGILGAIIGCFTLVCTFLWPLGGTIGMALLFLLLLSGILGIAGVWRRWLS